MHRRIVLTAALATAAYAGYGLAQYPILDRVAERVIGNYQNASCQQLWEKKGQPKSEEQQRVIGLLRNDPQMREYFLNKVAAPIANKMFSCGMIP